MVKKFNERTIRYKEKSNGGAGHITLVDILSEAEMHKQNRVFSHVTLDIGCEQGPHTHHGEGEAYYIIRGQGLYNDNGTMVPVEVGDVTFVEPEEIHGIINTGREPLEFIALVPYC